MAVSSDPTLVRSYHAHIYYDRHTKHIATKLRDEFIEYKQNVQRADLDIGRMHDVPVGPHTKAMFRVALHSFDFKIIINHLILNRQGLSVLIHPETGNDLKDHTEHSIWLGTPLPLDLSKL